MSDMFEVIVMNVFLLFLVYGPLALWLWAFNKKDLQREAKEREEREEWRKRMAREYEEYCQREREIAWKFNAACDEAMSYGVKHGRD